MNPNIQIRIDQKRGCGWRKEGGLYMVAGGLSSPCGKLPIPLSVCPCCSSGIKPSRGWTWIDIDKLAGGKECDSIFHETCWSCPLSKPLGRCGLLWVGEKFYASPAEFSSEAARLGVSRRISAIPTGFKCGETWVAFAHRKAVLDPENAGEFKAAIFHLFRPTAIEYVCRGTETDEEIDALLKRGITPVKVERDSEAVASDLSTP